LSSYAGSVTAKELARRERVYAALGAFGAPLSAYEVGVADALENLQSQGESFPYH
jgi:hypothetical protein